MISMVYSVTVFVICAISCVYNAPADREEYTAQFGEPYDFDEYDVVYDRKQSNPRLNLRTTGDNPQVLILEPDGSKATYVGDLPLPGREPCADYVSYLESLIDFSSESKTNPMQRKVVVPYFCQDYIEMMEDRKIKLNAKNQYRKGLSSAEFLKKMMSLR